MKQSEVLIVEKFNSLKRLSNKVGMLLLILQISEVSHGIAQYFLQNQAGKEWQSIISFRLF